MKFSTDEPRITFWRRDRLVCSFDDVIHLTSEVIDSSAILRPTSTYSCIRYSRVSCYNRVHLSSAGIRYGSRDETSFWVAVVNVKLVTNRDYLPATTTSSSTLLPVVTPNTTIGT